MISAAVKYLTQSTWSHAALCVSVSDGGAQFVEADLMEGVRRVGLSVYAGYHCRICRPVGLSGEETDRVVGHAMGRIGHAYDTKNIVDLARYLIPTPPVPTPWRRKMISFGSGDPTRAICSGIVAESFQTIGYPVLPDISYIQSTSDECPGSFEELMHVRHHSLFVPRDFDVSPYFEIVKPSLVAEFDHRRLKWSRDEEAGASCVGAPTSN